MPYRKPRPSQPFHTLAPKVIHTIRQKDIYGFFSEPVDTALVPDYNTVIKRPMDLGTMLRKAENREYTDLQQVEVTYNFTMLERENDQENVRYVRCWAQQEKVQWLLSTSLENLYCLYCSAGDYGSRNARRGQNSFDKNRTQRRQLRATGYLPSTTADA